MDDVELRRELEAAHSDCVGWALACCGRDRDNATEVLHAVYLTVLERRARFDQRSTFRTWLFGVIRRTAAGERRKRWLRSLLLARKGEWTAPSAPMPADMQLEVAGENDRLRGALMRLPARQREVVQLVFFHELTIEEIDSLIPHSMRQGNGPCDARFSRSHC